MVATIGAMMGLAGAAGGSHSGGYNSNPPCSKVTTSIFGQPPPFHRSASFTAMVKAPAVEAYTGSEALGSGKTVVASSLAGAKMAWL